MRMYLCAPILAAIARLVLTGLTQAEARPTTRPAATADIPVKEVALFFSGVGYFEHAGTVRGDGEIILHFKTE